ncbi:hypothetical protein PR048_021505 [Dryococelus australis]|uniref:Uncharacterized protein n=1 Tax=Dryococelus australis TaxID=614101 RepID=A0ABQ9GYF5_9NEOP|nr:hypothetical protein PR048_021505 [Dryococelus australis]
MCSDISSLVLFSLSRWHVIPAGREPMFMASCGLAVPFRSAALPKWGTSRTVHRYEQCKARETWQRCTAWDTLLYIRHGSQGPREATFQGIQIEEIGKEHEDQKIQKGMNIMPAVDGFGDLTSSSVSYEEFVTMDDDVVVCGEKTDAEIVAEVVSSRVQSNGSSDEENEPLELPVQPLPTSVETMEYISMSYGEYVTSRVAFRQGTKSGTARTIFHFGETTLTDLPE